MKTLLAIFILITLASCGDESYINPASETYSDYAQCISDDPDLETYTDEEKFDLDQACRVSSGWEGFCYFPDNICNWIE